MINYVIIGNFGNHSLAVMQALIERNLSPSQIHFIYVDTGWAASSWPARVSDCSAYSQRYGIRVHHLKAKASFSEMILDRKQFPNRKFQWCAGFLKGLAILEFLDEFDPLCEAQIVSGKRQADSRRYKNLQEFDYENELYQGRTIWYPLWQTDNGEFTRLIQLTGFPLLNHSSLECSPCIHANIESLSRLESSALVRLEILEQTINQTMFQKPIADYGLLPTSAGEAQATHLQQFDLGCGAPWGCGE